ncbi:MAG: hypothetical protein GY710_27370, partial [Desulfobacteraceae bacterium]|nr:hypothetical protein [Desulfobacteraceae bacterium]
GNNCHTVIFPHDQDANEYFIKNSAKDFWYLTKEAGQVKQTPLHQSSFSIAHSLFKIKWAEVKGTKLNVTLKAENLQTKRFILDTFNLYSERDRTKLAGKAAELFKLSHDQLDKDILEWIPDVEKQAKAFKENPEQLKGMTASPENILTEYEEQEAHSFLQSPDLIDLIKRDYEELGYIGEETNKVLAYLVMTSRKMKNPLSLIIMSNSAAGKSSLQKCSMQLCPEDEGKHFTRLTQQSLYYLGEESIKHKCLSIEEEEGTSEASYSLKTLLSAKVLNVAATTQDPVTGKKKAEEYKTEGPLAVMMSTTSPELEAELASRTLIISIDESENQTTQIHNSQRSSRTYQGRKEQLKKDNIQRKHHNAQRMLDTGLAIINNYAEKLSFPVDRLKYRRGHEHYLDLIDAIAFLRQKQKVQRSCEVIGRYIEVEREDIAMANDLFAAVMGWSIDELSPPTRSLLKALVMFCQTRSSWIFTRKEIRSQIKWSNTHLHNHLRKLEELEYIVAITGEYGSKYTYRLLYEGDGENSDKFVIGLKNPEKLEI